MLSILKAKRVFVGFGGAASQKYTDRLLEIITKPENVDYHFIVVLRRTKHNWEIDKTRLVRRYDSDMGDDIECMPTYAENNF